MQRSIVRLRFASSLAAACLVWTLSSVPACADAPVNGMRLQQLPQAWRDDIDRPLALESLSGHRVILTMAYATCHRICPMTIDGLKRMQKVLDARGESVDFVVIGYDPANDKPADWHQYRLTRHLLRKNWFFLTGSLDDTQQIARQLGFDFWKMDEHVMHGSRVLVFDARGHQEAALGSDTRRWIDAL